MEETLERKIIELVAADRIDVPISSMSSKLKRRKPKMAQDIDLEFGQRYNGERVFAYIKDEDEMKARGLREGVDKFVAEFPKYGAILTGYIEEQRAVRERYLVFGMKEGCIVTADDYRGIMTNLGFTSVIAERLYPELMDISRKLRKKRDEGTRSILIEQGI